MTTHIFVRDILLPHADLGRLARLWPCWTRQALHGASRSLRRNIAVVVQPCACCGAAALADWRTDGGSCGRSQCCRTGGAETLLRRCTPRAAAATASVACAPNVPRRKTIETSAPMPLVGTPQLLAARQRPQRRVAVAWQRRRRRLAVVARQLPRRRRAAVRHSTPSTTRTARCRKYATSAASSAKP